MRRRGAWVLAVVLVVAVAATALVLVLNSRGGSDDDAHGGTHEELTYAMTHALGDGRRFSWTDWTGVRSELEAHLDAGSDPGEVRRFLSRGFSADLTSASALLSSAGVLQQYYAFSPATLSWELFTQSSDASVEMLGLAPGTDTGSIEQSLRNIGYTPPSSPDGIWRGNLDDIKRVGDVTPELTFISIDAAHGVLLASDTDTGLAEGLDAYQAAAGVAGGLDDVVGSVGDPSSAELYSSDQVCNALAMANAGPSDQAAGASLIARAGEVSPLTGFAMADQPDGQTLVVLSFETDDQARTNATTRAALASGPAPGQGGDFSDRFTLGRVQAQGRVVTMVLQPKPGAYVLSDLSTGPLLFATC